MHLIIDGRTLCARDGTIGAGIEHYTWELTRALVAQVRDCRVTITVPYSLSNSRLREFVAGTSVRVIRLRPSLPIFTRHVITPLIWFLLRADVVFSPGGQIPRLWKGKSVVTVHDVMHLTHPEWFVGRADALSSVHSKLKRTFVQASRLILVSQAVKEEVIKLFPQVASKIDVVYEGVSPVFVEADRKATIFPFDKEFVLFVGTVEPRKNLARAIEAFDAYLSAHEEQASTTRFLLAGRVGWDTQSIFDEMRRVNARWEQIDRDGVVRWLGVVTEQEKWSLYAHAGCLLFPTLWEGFGLPVLEAMSVSKPVITTRCGAIPEVAGDAAIYIDPENTEAIAFAIAQVLLVPEGTALMREEGVRRAKKFSWESAAKKTLDIIRASSANRR